MSMSQKHHFEENLFDRAIKIFYSIVWIQDKVNINFVSFITVVSECIFIDGLLSRTVRYFDRIMNWTNYSIQCVCVGKQTIIIHKQALFYISYIVV